MTTGYAHMDHAQWVEHACKVQCSEIGRKAAYILGITFGGIYNAPIEHHTVAWSHPRHIIARTVGARGLATWDFDQLTKLVLLAHELCVRVEVSPVVMATIFENDGETVNQQYLGQSHEPIAAACAYEAAHEFHFSPRQRDGGLCQRHPTLEEAVAQFRGWFDEPAQDLRIREMPAESGFSPSNEEAKMDTAQAGEGVS